MSQTAENNSARTLMLKVAYDGTDFYGWQIQPQRATIQGSLVAALQKVCGELAAVCGAGRTDAGVHAAEQVAHVKLVSPIPCPNLVKALNGRLPESIRILSVEEVSRDFHARRDARSKTYLYRVFRGAICPPWFCRYVFPLPYPLDEEAMRKAAKHFEGTRDFRSFASAEGEASREDKSSVRTVFFSELKRQGEELAYTVEGNGFLHHMVRNMVGTLLEVGRGRISPEGIREILSAGRRSAAGPTVPARGLHLVRVNYSSDPSSLPPLWTNQGIPLQ